MDSNNEGKLFEVVTDGGESQSQHFSVENPNEVSTFDQNHNLYFGPFHKCSFIFN